METTESRAILENRATQVLKPIKNKIELVKMFNEMTGQKQVSLARIAVKKYIENRIPFNQLENWIRTRYADTAIQVLTKALARKHKEKLLLRATQANAAANQARQQAQTRRNEDRFLEQQRQARLQEVQRIPKIQQLDQRTIKQISNRKLNRKLKMSRPSLVNPNMKPYPTDNTYNGLLRVLKQFSRTAQQRDKEYNVVVEITDNTTGKIKRSKQYTIPSDQSFSEWWGANSFQYTYKKDTDDTDGEIFTNATTIVYQERPVQVKTRQVFRDGGETHCVLSHIRKFLDDYNDTDRGKTHSKKNNKKYEKYATIYEAGVPEENMTALCDDFNVRIIVKYPLNKSHTIYGTAKKVRKVITLTNTSFNHLEDIGEMLDLNNPNRETTTRDELLDIKEQLDDDKTPYWFCKDNINISSIITKDIIYETNTDFKEEAKKFEADNHIDEFKICDIDDPALTAYVKQGTHYNNSCFIAGRPEFKMNDEDPTLHIDIKKAYARYYESKHYTGFLGKITDMRPTDKINGLGIYTIDNLNMSRCSNQFIKLNEKLGAYKSGGTYPSVELLFLEQQGAKFKIVYGCWGVKTADIRFNEGMFKKTPEGSSYYALMVGKLDSHILTSNYYTPSTQEYFNNIEGNSDHAVKFFGNDELKIEIAKDRNRHYGHYTAFVLAYMRLTMIDQLLKMKLDKVNFIYVDGIYYQPHEFEMDNAFVVKHSDWKKHYTGSSINLRDRHIRDNEPIGQTYLSNNEISFNGHFKRNYNIKQQKRDHYAAELFTGAGGTGKTHYNLKDTGLIRPLYVATSHKLVAEKRAEYSVNGEVFEVLINEQAHTFKAKTIWNFYNTLIVDEASQIRNCDMKRLLKLYPDHKIIICGDIGFQVAPINTSKDETDGGDIQETIFNHTQEFKQNHRCKCDVLLTKLNYLREFIKEGRMYLKPNDLFKLKAGGQTIYAKDLIGLYKETDSIITGTHKQQEYLTEIVKDSVKNKYAIKKGRGEYHTGDILIQDNIPEEFDKIKDLNKHIKLEHAHTIHSIQGLTLKTKLFIDVRKCVKNMDLRMIYTALSRGQYFKNIYFIIDREEDLIDEDFEDEFYDEGEYFDPDDM